VQKFPSLPKPAHPTFDDAVIVFDRALARRAGELRTDIQAKGLRSTPASLPAISIPKCWSKLFVRAADISRSRH
jgi:hypothetical protein